jgi:hypothetical protein
MACAVKPGAGLPITALDMVALGWFVRKRRARKSK